MPRTVRRAPPRFSSSASFGGKSSPTDTRNLLFRLILARRPSSYSDRTGSTGAALVLRRRFGRGAGGAFDELVLCAALAP